MSFETIIPLASVDEASLRGMIDQISNVSGTTITIESMIVISTNDKDVSLCLDSLAEAIKNRSNGHKPEPVECVAGKKRGPKSKVKEIMGGGEKKEPSRGPHIRSIQVNGSGEMISRYELNKRLADHTIKPGTVLHSPKHGKIIVNAPGADDQPYVWQPLG